MSKVTANPTATGGAERCGAWGGEAYPGVTGACRTDLTAGWPGDLRIWDLTAKIEF